jgi:integrase
MGSYGKKKDANRRVVDLKHNLISGEPVFNGVDFATLIKRYLDYRKINLSISTYNYYTRISDKYIIPTLGEVKLDELTYDDIDDYIHKQRSSLSSKTLETHLNIIKPALDYAVDTSLIKSNPAKYMKLSNSSSDKNSRIVQDKDEIVNLLKEARGTKLELPLYLASGAGLKLSEILGLTWDNIDFKNKKLNIDKVVVRENGTVILKEPRSNSIIRTIYLSKSLISILRDKKDNTDFLYKTGKRSLRHNLILHDIDGNPIAEDVISRRLSEFIKRNSLPHITFQGLRHFYVNLLIESEVSISTISKLIGHSNVSTTIKMYSPLLEKNEDIGDISEKIFSEMF